MRILVFLLFSFAASAQIPLYQLEYAPDSMKVIGAAADGEPIWVDRSSAAKVKNSPTMTLRIQNDSIRADIKKRLNAINVGGADVFLGLQIDSTGQIYGVNEILSDDFDKDQFNELQGISIDSLNRVFRITLTDGGVVKFLDRGITTNDSIYFSQDTIFLRDGSGNVILPKWYKSSSAPSVGAPYKHGDFYVHQPFTGCPQSWSLYQYINDEWATVFAYECPPLYIDPDPSPTNELADYRTLPFNIWFGIPKKGDFFKNTTLNELKIYDGTSFVDFWKTDTTAINNIISDSLATITTEPDSIQRVGNVISLRDGNGSVDVSDLVNVADSTIVQNSYGTIITESPTNTWNIKVDSSKFVTPYDLTLIPNPPDSTVIVDGWGITSVELPTNTYNIMADSSQVFTQYDGTLKQDKLISGTNIKTVNGNTLLGSGDLVISGGVTSVTASSPLSSSGGATPNITADTTSSTGLSTQYDLTLKQDKLTGANKRIPYFSGTSTLSNSDNLVFDNATKYLGIGTASPDATIHMTQATGNRIRFTDPSAGTNYKNWQIFAGSGSDERNLSFQSLSDAGSEYNFMTFRKATNSQIIANWYAPFISSTTGTGENVMTINEVGSIYRSPLKTINSSSLFGSGDISLFTLPSLTSGSVLFSNGTTISQDNSNFFWNNTIKRLGIGTSSPFATLSVLGRMDLRTSVGNNMFITGGNDAATGAENIGIGNTSLNSVTTGAYNTALGSQSLFSLTTGSHNFGLGFQSLQLANSQFNVAIGYQALRNSTGKNIGIGYTSGVTATGTDNIIMGFESGTNASSRNIIMGTSAGISAGNDNVSIGYNSFQGSGNNSIAIGRESLKLGGTNNIALGYLTLGSINTASTNNIAIGDGSLRFINGNQNVAIGPFSGDFSSGSGNVFLGYTAGRFVGGTGNKLVIENSDSNTPLIGGHFDNNRVGINTEIGSIANTLHVTGGARITDLAGSGTRMVTTTASGDLGTAAIPTGTVTSVNIINGGGLGVTGGPITTSGSITLTAVDGSITNEGRIGVTAGGSNSAGLQGYNEPGTTTGAAATINGSGGVLITETAGTPSGGTINVEAVGSHIVQISRTTTLTNSTAGTYTFNFTNQDVLLPASPAPYTADLGNDEIVFTNTGTYEVTFSGVGTISGGNNIYFERWNGSSWGYINSAGEGYASGTYANITFTALAQFIANDKIRIRYGVSTGQTASFDYSRLIVKRIR